LIFATEIRSEFNTPSEGAAWFPFDMHELGVRFTSNWDQSDFILIPHADNPWTKETAILFHEKPITRVVDQQTARIRQDELREALTKVWTWSDVLLQFKTNIGFTGVKYSECTAIMLVERRYALFIIYEVLRPLVLALLCPLNLNFFDNDTDRLTYVLTVILAMSFAFVRASTERITLVDYYRLSMFVFAGFTLVVSSFTFLFPNLENSNIIAVAWTGFLFFHLPVIFPIIYLHLPYRRKARKRYFAQSSIADVEHNIVKATSRALRLNRSERKRVKKEKQPRKPKKDELHVEVEDDGF